MYVCMCLLELLIIRVSICVSTLQFCLMSIILLHNITKYEKNKKERKYFFSTSASM